MPSTALHHKPIVYGSDVADWAFYVLVALHAVPALVAPIAAVVAFATKKGGPRHLSAGKWLVRSMTFLALTGIIIDGIRLAAWVPENHTKYAGLSMPSTYPARLGFLYAGFCVLYLLYEAAPPRVFRLARAGKTLFAWLAPTLLLGLGAGLVVLVVVRYNPWTGALWMIVTLMLVVAFNARGRLRLRDRRGSVAHHRYGMAFLAAFSWWGALQGFGPAIGIALGGPDLSTQLYVGNQPGPFTPMFFAFLVGWAPIFLLALYLVRRYKKRHEIRAAGAGAAAE